jgi:hypothetical protein
MTMTHEEVLRRTATYREPVPIELLAHRLKLTCDQRIPVRLSAVSFACSAFTRASDVAQVSPRRASSSSQDQQT